MILPPRPRAIMRRAASRPTWNEPVRWISTTRRHSSVLRSSIGLRSWNAGVVDENVDLDARGVEMLEGGEDRRFVGDVEGARVRRLCPSVRERLGGARELLLVAAVENDRGARPPRGRAPSRVRARPRSR